MKRQGRSWSSEGMECMVWVLTARKNKTLRQALLYHANGKNYKKMDRAMHKAVVQAERRMRNYRPECPEGRIGVYGASSSPMGRLVRAIQKYWLNQSHGDSNYRQSNELPRKTWHLLPSSDGLTGDFDMYPFMFHVKSLSIAPFLINRKFLIHYLLLRHHMYDQHVHHHFQAFRPILQNLRSQELPLMSSFSE